MGWSLAVLTAVVTLGGCVGADAPEPSGPATAETGSGPTPEGEAGVFGQVVGPDFEALTGVRVRLAAGEALVGDTATDGAGRYAFEGLAEGEYRLQVTAICCREAMRGVYLTGGRQLEVHVQLEPFPETQDPYVEDGQWEGFLPCSVRTPTGTGVNLEACDDLDPNSSRRHEFQLKPGLQTAVVAMDWEPVTTNLAGEMVLRFYKGSSWNGNTFFREASLAAIEVTLGPEDAEDGERLHFDKIDEPWDVRFQFWAGGSPNVVYQQPFTVWYALHYWDTAPSGTSALP